MFPATVSKGQPPPSRLLPVWTIVAHATLWLVLVGPSCVELLCPRCSPVTVAPTSMTGQIPDANGCMVVVQIIFYSHRSVATMRRAGVVSVLGIWGTCSACRILLLRLARHLLRHSAGCSTTNLLVPWFPVSAVFSEPGIRLVHNSAPCCPVTILT